MSESVHAGRPTVDARASAPRKSVERHSDPAELLAGLQHAAGNAAVNALIARHRTPPKPPPTMQTVPVQRDPDAVAAFADQWMREHIVIGNAAFTLIGALPEDRRAAVLARIRTRYGNEYIRRGQAGLLPEKQPDDKPSDPLNAEDYWKKHGKAHLDGALTRTMANIDFEIAGPGLGFERSECSAFTSYALTGRMQRLDPADVSQLLEVRLFELVDGVRVLDDLDRGPDVYEPAVTERIVERLGLGLRRATTKLSLPYALARAKVIQDARAKDPFGMPQPGPVADPDPDQVLQTQPPAGSFGAQTTIEHAVAEAMTSGSFVTFDEASFGMMYVPQLTGEPRPVDLELERGGGDWKVARVVKPPTATAADVAHALFGTPENAHLVVGRGDRYAFAFPPSGVLAEPYDSIWHDHIEVDEGGGPLELIWGRAPSDPVWGLDAESADQRALDTVAGRHADGDQGAVLQRLEIIQSHLVGIAAAAGPLGVAGFVEPVLGKIKERMTACAGDPAVAQKWSAHTAEQISVLSEVKTGFEAITRQMFAAGLPAVSTPEGEELVGDVTAFMQGPTIELTKAYAGVVSASDQLDLATARLTTAKERLAAYPFDMADRMLAMIRKRVASLDKYATMAWESYSRGRLDALQAEISQQVAELRVSVVNGDGTAANRLSELKSQLAMLDLQSTVGSTISLIHNLSDALWRSESWSPDTERQTKIYDELKLAMQPWSTLGADYDELWKAGKERDEAAMASIRQRVEALRKDSPLPALIKEVASFQEDEAKRQRIIAIGIMIAAALVAVATGGWASGAIGGAAGAIVGAGMEALTFTAITGTLNADQTFGGFMAELGINFVTFGGLRAISGTAKLMAGAGKLSLAHTAAEMTVEGLWMVAATKAGEEIRARLSKGEKVSTQTAATIFGHQMLISFAGRVIARGAVALIEARAEITKLKEVQAYLAKQQEAESLARGFLAKGDDTVGPALVRADTDALRAEVSARQKLHEIASNPAEAKKYGLELSAAELATLAGATRAATRELTEREINTLMQKVEVQADHAIAEPAVYAELVQKHRQQGSSIVEGIDAAGNPKARIAPQSADGTFGAPFTLHSRLGAEVEEILASKGLQGSSVMHDYLVARAGDRAGALADLRKVKSASELNALMEKTLEERMARLRAADGCFVAGTPVQTVAGLRPIETVAVGDHVVATDPTSRESGLCPVTAITTHPDRPLITVRVGDQTILCTAAHPFWVEGSGWLPAGALTAGAVLRRADGSVVAVADVRRSNQAANVYNLTVGGTHSYHVSAEQVLVHNKPTTTRVLDPAVVAARDSLAGNLVAFQRRTTRLRGQAGEIPMDRPERAALIQRSDELEERVQTLRDDIGDASTLDELNRVLRPDVERAREAFTALQEEINAAWVPRPTVAEVAQIDAYTQAFGNLRAAVDAGDLAAQAASRRVLDRIEAAALRTRNSPKSPTARLQDHIATMINQRRLVDAGGAYGVFGQQLPCQASAAAAGLRGQTYFQIEAALGIPVRDLSASAPIGATGSVRFVWTFGDGSRIIVDLPGSGVISSWQISREAHLAIYATPPNRYIHLSQEGIAVPDMSAPSHLPIIEDRLLRARAAGDMRAAADVLQ